MNNIKTQKAGGYLLSILVALIFVVIAQWSVLGYPIFYNSLLYVALFLLHGYVFGLKKGMVGATAILLFLVIMLVSDNCYYMTHFFQNGLMMTACVTGGLLKIKRYYLSSVSLAVTFTLFGFAHHYHSKSRYSTNEKITIEAINSTNSKLIDHNGEQLKLYVDTVYLVNFSFRNCAPCKRKKKSIEKMAVDFKNTPFKVIEIHAFENKQIFDTDYFFNYAETYHDTDNELSKKMKVIGAPTEFIFDKNGNFVRRLNGFEQAAKANYEETTYLLLKNLIHEN
ncbi:MAG: redoxin domain-containing protein [Crocinitomicaceae bacterium]|nr:redoxin domain-containing protein [Crocinitomicaceae bacterium]NGF74559.1 redoxin domain-containing protein [Fluviicola sp. SGL-29]